MVVWPHEVEPWFHSWYRGRVETLDAKYNLAYINSTLCGHTNSSKKVNSQYQIEPISYYSMRRSKVLKCFLNSSRISGGRRRSSIDKYEAGAVVVREGGMDCLTGVPGTRAGSLRAAWKGDQGVPVPIPATPGALGWTRSFSAI